MLFANLDAEEYDREYTDRALIARLARYFAPHRRRVALIMVTTATIAALQAAVPILISRSVSLANGFGGGSAAGRAGASAATGQAAGASQTLWLVVGAVLVIAVVVWLLNWLRRRETVRAIGDVTMALRRDAFAATVSHDLSFYDKFASGRIVSRITSDTQDLGQSINLVADQVSQVVQVVILATVLASLSWPLMLMMVLWAPIVVLAAMGFRGLARRATRQGFRAIGDVNAKIFETVAGISVAKNFRREASIYGEFIDVNNLSYGLNLRRGFTLAAVFPTLNILSGAGTGLLVYYGAVNAASGAIALGSWFLFLQSIEAFWFPLMNMSAFWSQVQAGFSALERVFALIDAPPAVKQRASDPVPPLKGDIRFEGVRFSYEDGAVVLPHFNLHIKPGESIALVGHTGAGKSSIAKLVARFYEFQDGRLLVDEHDIRTFDLASYHRQLGIVPQVPFLFGGTVAENIRYARPQATDAEITAMARRIGEGEWLEVLPEGLETNVGERGNQLSMGQRQLVALMRVLVQRPAIFILDEATASVDPFTEAQIQEALELLLEERTSIIIAHRLTTVRAADRILVMKQGEIIEEGSHDALMAAGGHYAELYDTYFRHQSLDYEPDGHVWAPKRVLERESLAP